MIAESEAIQRARFVEREPLGAAVLAAEQSARLSQRWLHQIAEHDWGIVVGLAVETSDLGITIQPGVAVDGYGRELVLGEPLRLDWGGWKDENQPEHELNLFDLLGSQTGGDHKRGADLWLLWDRRPDYPPAAGHHPSGPGQHSRWLDIPRLRVLPAQPGQPAGDPADPNALKPGALNPRTPPGVDADTAVLLPGEQTDDPALEWAVYLGRVWEDVQDNPAEHYAVDAAIPRPYAQLRGETVSAASRLAQMQLSGGPGRSRFGVALPVAGKSFDHEPLTINEPGELVTHGETHLVGSAYQDPDTQQIVEKQGDLLIENRPVFDTKDVGSVTTLVQMLTNQESPAARAIYARLPVETQQSLNKINLGERLVGVNLRKLIATDLSTIVKQGLPVSIFNKLPLNIIGGLPGGLAMPFVPRALPFVPRASAISRAGGLPAASRRMMMSRRSATGFIPPAEAVNFGVGQNTEASLSQEEVRALFETLFPGLLTDTGGGDWGVTFRALAQLPAEAAPWQIYHGVIKPEESPPSGGVQQGSAAVKEAAPKEAAEKQSAKEIHQLRIEIQNPGETGDPRLYRFVIGMREDAVAEDAGIEEGAVDDAVVNEWAADREAPFTECLIVQADGTVVMLGEQVRVNGQVLEGPVQANPDDPRLAAVLVASSARFTPSSTALGIEIVPTVSKLQYTITNKTTSPIICSPPYERIYEVDNGRDGSPVRQGSVGGQLTILGGKAILVETTTAGLPKNQILRVKLRVIGADQNGNYAVTDVSKDVTIPTA